MSCFWSQLVEGNGRLEEVDRRVLDFLQTSQLKEFVHGLGVNAFLFFHRFPSETKVQVKKLFYCKKNVYFEIQTNAMIRLPCDWVIGIRFVL